MNKRKKNEKLIQKNLYSENSVYLSQEIAKKKILSQAQPKKGEVWWDSTEGNDRIWVLKRGKDLLTALSTNYRSCHCQGAGSPYSKRKGWGRQREVWSQSVDERFWSETSCPHWTGWWQVYFLHSSKIPLDPFLRLPYPHLQPKSPCFSSPWAPSKPVQTQIHTDPCLMLISKWGAPGRPSERSLKKALSIALEGRDSGRTFLRISSQWLLQASFVWALLKVFHITLKKAMLSPGFYEW